VDIATGAATRTSGVLHSALRRARHRFAGRRTELDRLRHDNTRLHQRLARAIELERELRQQAFHDHLTGLANRALLLDRTEHALSGRERDRVLGLLFVDIDGFKSVNDRFGHVCGDLLLAAVGERMRACVRPQDTAARIGGDEFAILIEDSADPSEVTGVARRLVRELARPFTLEGRSISVRASIGMTFASPGERAAVDLLRHADSAMYTAKARGGGRVEYRPAVDSARR
jgi:diguanylate cyclase (GGDEF)-like protein